MGLMLFFRRPDSSDKRPWVIRDEETGEETRAGVIYSRADHETAGPFKGFNATWVIRYPNAELTVEGDKVWIKNKK